jgi:oligopeptidase B
MVQPPVAPRRPHERRLHGTVAVDDYAWMAHDAGALEEHLRAERDHYEAATAPLEPLQRRLFTEMVARTPLTEEGPVVRIGDAEFRDLVPEGAQLGQFQRRRSPEHPWVAVLDLDAEAAAAGSTYAEAGVREVSPDGATLAWSLDVTGEEVYRLRFRSLADCADRDEQIESTYYGGAWSADSSTFFYTRVDHVYRPHQVWRHELGCDPAHDVLVVQEDDRRFELGVRASRCGQWVLIEAFSRDASECWAIPADDPTAGPTSIGGRRDGHEYHVEPVPGGPRPFLAVSNHGGASEFTLSWLGLGDTDPLRWPSALPDPAMVDGEVAARALAPRRYLDLDAFAGHVVVTARQDGEPALLLVPVRADGLDWAAAQVHVAPVGTSLALAGNEVFDTAAVTVRTESRVHPRTWWDQPLDGGERTLRHRAEAPNHDPDSYVVTRHWVTARDGERIPVTLVAHRVTPMDGTAPCLLYGYGAYEYVYEQSFSRTLPSLLDRGIVFAHAHVRGGGELGRRWWDAGHLAHKANSFRDFVDVARELGSSGPSARVDGSRIVARGGSAGGLLVAASMDLDPEAFAGIIAEVPFVDVVNSMLDPELPLTVGEWEEWGNPAIPDQYAWLAAYSPYENVPPPGRRPFILATGAVHDPRVLVHEPAKWVARLRATDPERGAVEQVGRRGGVLLRVALAEGSHGGAAGRFAWMQEEAQTQSVILAAMGIGA